MKTSSDTILKVDKKITNRLLVVSSQLINKLSLPVFNLFTSLLIVNLYSKELWGEYVYFSLIAMIVVTIASWGSQDYLIRKFSIEPSGVTGLWASNTMSRSLIFFVAVAPAIYFMRSAGQTHLIFLLYSLSLAAYKSFDVLIIYYRRFLVAVLLEVTGFVIILICVLLMSNLKIDELLLIFTVANCLKIFPLLWIYVFQSGVRQARFNFKSLLESFPFFLPSFIGLVQSRIDLYIIALFLNKDNLASYQIYLSMLSMVHQGALLLISPYVKNLYRFTQAKIIRFAWRFFLWGIAFSVIALPIIFLILKFLYHIRLTTVDYLLGILILLPLFFYSIKTYSWFKNGQQYTVAMVNAVMAVSALALSVFLIPQFGITGGLMASAMSQWFAFIIFTVKK